MFNNLWALLTGDQPRYLYGEEMIAQINQNRRYQIVANKTQTRIYIFDSQYHQRIAQLYDISYALVIADALNSQAAMDEEDE